MQDFCIKSAVIPRFFTLSLSIKKLPERKVKRELFFLVGWIVEGQPFILFYHLSEISKITDIWQVWAFLGKFGYFFGSQELFILFSWWFHRLGYSETLLLAVFSSIWRFAAWLTCRVPLLAQLRAFGSAPGVPASPLPVFLLLLEAGLHLFAAWLP